MTIHEIVKGITLPVNKGAASKAAALKSWPAWLVAGYCHKILEVDATTAANAGQLEAKANSAGHHLGMADATIVDIAAAHGLIIVTRNT